MLQSAHPRDISTPFYPRSHLFTPPISHTGSSPRRPGAPPGNRPPTRPGTKSPKNKTQSSPRRLRGCTAANAATRCSRRRAPAAPTRPPRTPIQAEGSRPLRPALTTFPGPGRRRDGAEASPPARSPASPPSRPSLTVLRWELGSGGGCMPARPLALPRASGTAAVGVGTAAVGGGRPPRSYCGCGGALRSAPGLREGGKEGRGGGGLERGRKALPGCGRRRTLSARR